VLSRLHPALALHQFQAVDLAFGDAVAPLQAKPGFDRAQIVLQPTCEAGQCPTSLWVASAIHGTWA
jgi:hypothetical protein